MRGRCEESTGDVMVIGIKSELAEQSSNSIRFYYIHFHKKVSQKRHEVIFPE